MTVFSTILMLVVIVAVHELAHAVTAVSLGYRIKGVYLGIPLKTKIGGYEISTIIFEKEFFGVKCGLSILLLGGAVQFEGEEKAEFWKMALIALAGPASNFLIAFAALLIVEPVGSAIFTFGTIIDSTLTGLGMILWGMVPATEIGGPVALGAQVLAVSHSYNNGAILAWIIINVSLAIINLLPVPALDGGQVLISAIKSILGEKYHKPAENIVKISLYLLISMMIFLTIKDIAWFFI